MHIYIYIYNNQVLNLSQHRQSLEILTMITGQNVNVNNPDNIKVKM